MDLTSQDEEVKKGTDHYIDDIWVNESVVGVDKVRQLLLKYGLVTKEPGDGKFVWCRDGEIPVLSERVTKRELFSVCGKLVGHYPIAGWLRTACSFVKRLANDVEWDANIPSFAEQVIYEVLQKLVKEDPVKGVWEAKNSTKGVVWCDASSLATGCCLQIDGQVMEDCAWLRRDASLINVADL